MRSPSLRRLSALALLLALACDHNVTQPEVGSPHVLGLTLSATTPSLPADGVSTTTIVATVADTAALFNKLVSITTDNGILVPSGQAAIPLDNDAHASTILRASRVPGQATVRASAGTSTVTTTVQFVRAYPSEVVIDPSLFSALDTATITLSAEVRRSPGTPSSGARITWFAKVGADSVGIFGTAGLTDTLGKSTVKFALAGRAPLTALTSVTFTAYVATDAAGEDLARARTAGDHVARGTTAVLFMPLPVPKTTAGSVGAH